MQATTEARASEAIDSLPTLQSLQAMLQGQMDGLQAVTPALPLLAQAAEAAAARLAEQGRLIYVGAGTSGRIAVQDGVELLPTFRWPETRVAYVLAGGLGALLTSVEGAEDDANAARLQIDTLQLSRNDVVIGLAASGQTPFTVAAIEQAHRCGALTIGISNNAQTALSKAAMFGLEAVTGAELVAGSTRMKAGTAQKVLLNLLSTQIMIRLHRVYAGMMVDVVAANDKLRQRCVRMLQDLTGCTQQQAQQHLHTANNHVKTAVLLTHGLGLAQAQKALEQHRGDLRAVLATL